MNMAHSLPRNSMSLQILEDYRRTINQAIEQFLDTMPAALGMRPESLSTYSLDAFAKSREYTMRPGKRIRGALAAAAYDDAKGTHLADAGIALAVAQELIQSYLLITDDVADRSELRRGKPTVHREYMAELDKYGDEHEANMLAQYVGLITEQIAYLALLQAPERPEHIMGALHSLHGNLTVTGLGQIDDIYHKVGRSVSQDEIIRVYSLKTGYYTFVNPLQAGLLLAGITDTDAMQQITVFGMAAGIAFQMHDDYLGVFGDTAETGKPSDDDLKEGKYTMLVQYALEHAKTDDAVILRQILGNLNISTDAVRRAQQIFNDSGATLYIQAETHRYAEIAKKQLADIAVWSEQFKAFLSDLVDFAISRQS